MPKIDCACYTSVYQPIFTSHCLPFTHTILLTDTIGEATYWHWRNIDVLCPTFSWFLSSCSFPLYWPSQTPFQAVLLPSMWAESIRKHLVRYSHPTNLGILDPECHCVVLYPCQHLPHNRLCCDLDYPIRLSSEDNFRCLKYFHACCIHRFQYEYCRFCWVSGHLIFVFVL